MQYVIIGNGIAAAGAVEGIRHLDKEGAITVIDGERRGSYSRPLITYYLTGKRKPEQMRYRSERFFQQHRVKVLPEQALKIDPQAGQVMLRSGQVLGYDRLLLATGASPVIPEILEKNGCDRVKTMYTWQDAEQLDLLIKPGQPAVVMGSGLIGLKTAEALCQRGMRITIIEKQPQVLPRLLSGPSAQLVGEHLLNCGMEILTSREVTGLQEDGQVIELDNGRKIEAQLVIAAVGTKPNISLAVGGGLAADHGIKVDGYLRTSVANIYGAGDVIETVDILSGRPNIMALLPLAHREGFVAGQNMAGGTYSYPGGIFMNSVNLMGMNIMAAGTPSAVGTTWQWRENDQYLEITTEGSCLKHYIALNMSQVAGPLTTIIERQMNFPESFWPEFIRQPDLTSLPRLYWEELREVSG